MAGKYYEEFDVGDVYEHEPGRTLTQFDNMLFSSLTLNPQPLHLNEDFAADTEFGECIIHSGFTLSLVIGQSVGDTTLGTTVANLGMSEVEFPTPLFAGDTVYAETEVLEKRPSDSRPEQGIVQFQHRGRNQDGDLVARIDRAALMVREGTSP